MAQGLLQMWRWAFIAAIAGLLLGLAAGLFVTPVYEVEVKVLPADVNGSGSASKALGLLGGLGEMVGLNENSAKLKFEALEVLQSRNFIEGFITEKKLVQTLFYGSATSGSPEAPSRDDKAYTPVDAYTKFVSLLRVREDRRTGVITVSLSWTDPEQAAEWLNDLIARLNVEMRRRAVEVSDRNLRYLTEQIGKAEVIELREALFRLTEAEITRSMLAKVQPEYAFRVIDQALAPPEDDYVWPSYPLFGAAGAALGLLTGLIVLAIRRSAITSP